MTDPSFPKKSGGVNPEDYRTNAMIFSFEAISSSLQEEYDNKNRNNPVLTAANIALLVADIINFQNKYFGCNTSQPPSFTRFPYEILRDYKLHGHLHKLLRFMISYLLNKEWFKNISNTNGLLINLFNNNLYNEYIKMFIHLENTLKQSNIIKSKVITFSPIIQTQIQHQLAQIAKLHGAQVVNYDPNNADITHLILPDNDDMKDDGEENVRTLENNNDGLAYIHYYFYPSSYDQWIDGSLIDGQPDPIDAHYGAWHVGERFLTDLHKFNEWPVEIDYEIFDDDEPPQTQPQQPQPQSQTQTQPQPQQQHQPQQQQQQQQQQQVQLSVAYSQVTQHQHIQHPQQIIHAQNVVISNGNTAHLANANTIQPYINNNNYALNTLANAALNPNQPQTQQQSQSSKSRKRKRTFNDMDPSIVDDIPSDQEGEWLPPSKRTKTSHYTTNNNSKDVIDLIDDNNNNNNNNKRVKNKRNRITNGVTKKQSNKRIQNQNPNQNQNQTQSLASKKLKFTLKRPKHPSSTVQNKTIIKQEITSKKHNITPSLTTGDMFPYSGPTLTRIKPICSNYPIVIPSYSRWFRLDRINPIEYNALYTLFKNKSIQYHERYITIRNFIINTYRINPRIYLTVTSCRRMIADDAGAIYRIHKFLQKWGLINYQIDDGTIPEFEPPLLDHTHIDTPFGIKIALKPVNINDKLSNDDVLIKKDNQKKEKQLQSQTFKLRENIFSIAAGQNQKQNPIYKCNFCNIDCSKARYRCNIQSDMILCSKCYQNKRYSMIFNDNDFDMELNDLSAAKNNDNNDNSGDLYNKDNKVFNIAPWNDDELKKLKQGLKLYHDDWRKVSEYTGKDKNECIAQFLQLPITDPFLDNIENKMNNDINNIYHPEITNYISSSISGSGSGSNKEHMLSFLNPNPSSIPSPFADADHPILAQIASISSIVNNELVDIASNATLKHLTKETNIKSNKLSNLLKIGQTVNTIKGPGEIQNIINDNNNNNNTESQYIIKFDWGEATMSLNEINNIIDNNNNNLNNWQQYPQNINESKAKAAGILGVSTAISKSLKNYKDVQIQQLLQHLVLLQSQKVKAKLAHLEELWFALQAEREEVEEMKQELFRERIEIAKQRLKLEQDDDDDDNNNNVKTK